MSRIRTWSTTAASNNATPPDGWPEGMAPSAVNNTARETHAAIKTLAMEMLKGRVAGFQVTTNGTDPSHDLDIGPGICVSTTDDALIQLTSSITKQFDSTWVAGTAAGGLDTGTLAANTIYALWAIADTTNDLHDVLASLSFTKAGLLLPSGYTQAQLILAFRTDGTTPGNIVGLIHRDDVVEYDTSFVDIADNALVDGTEKTDTVTVPPWCEWRGTVRMINNNETATSLTAWVYRAGSDERTSVSVATVGVNMSTEAPDEITSTAECMVNGSSQLTYKVTETGGTADLRLSTHGFRMLTRGKGT